MGRRFNLPPPKTRHGGMYRAPGRPTGSTKASRIPTPSWQPRLFTSQTLRELHETPLLDGPALDLVSLKPQARNHRTRWCRSHCESSRVQTFLVANIAEEDQETFEADADGGFSRIDLYGRALREHSSVYELYDEHDDEHDEDESRLGSKRTRTERDHSEEIVQQQCGTCSCCSAFRRDDLRAMEIAEPATAARISGKAHPVADHIPVALAGTSSATTPGASIVVSPMAAPLTTAVEGTETTDSNCKRSCYSHPVLERDDVIRAFSLERPFVVARYTKPGEPRPGHAIQYRCSCKNGAKQEGTRISHTVWRDAMTWKHGMRFGRSTDAMRVVLQCGERRRKPMVMRMQPS